MTPDRRRHPRIAVVQPATLLRGDGSTIADCVLRDISVGGARLHFAAAADIPRTFNLQVPRGGKVRRHCERVWQSDREMGVRFLSGDAAPMPTGSDSGGVVTAEVIYL